MLQDDSLKMQEKCPHDITHYRKQGSSMTLTVPKSLRGVLNWEDGDILFVTAHCDTLVIVPAKSALLDTMAKYVKATGHIN